MKPKLVLVLFYSVLLALGIVWFLSGPELNSALFYLLFFSAFGFNAYCGYLELKAGTRQ
ncbi:hypothetical protein [Marinobacter sp. OP 3.4]|uniref:hypothetical protein n=1 Tax=Marinobacter sp. OP 3.4 TaxID=3076501 RepID=UPI002E1BE65C